MVETYGCNGHAASGAVGRGSGRVEGEDDHLPQCISGDQFLRSVDEETLEALDSRRSREEVIENVWGRRRSWRGRGDGAWLISLGLRKSLNSTESDGSDDDFGDGEHVDYWLRSEGL
jgi:hypothetical protein